MFLETSKIWLMYCNSLQMGFAGIAVEKLKSNLCIVNHCRWALLVLLWGQLWLVNISYILLAQRDVWMTVNKWKWCVWTTEINIYEGTLCSSGLYISSSETKAWQKFRPVQDLNLWPLKYHCNALLAELTSQLGAEIWIKHFSTSYTLYNRFVMFSLVHVWC